MAKANHSQGQRKPVKGLTLVKSKRYGDHYRNPRGTFKPAVLNETMEQSKNNLLQVNEIASLLFSGIRDEHRDGTLWPRILSALRNQLKEKNKADEFGLLNLECHAEHTLHKMLARKWDIDIAGIIKDRLHITVELSGAPRWKTKHMHNFQVSLHVIFPLQRNKLKKEIAHSEVLPLADYHDEIPFVIPVPSGAASYVVFLKVTGCKHGEPGNGLQSTGMRCVAVGGIPGKKNKPVKRKATPKKKQAVRK